MMQEKVLPISVLNQYRQPDTAQCMAALQAEIAQDPHQIIVIDDDPTGIQTVHGIHVYTDWDQESLDAGFAEPGRIFFILTNSRGMTREATRTVQREIAERAMIASRKTEKPFVLISRSDSTLRGHYPLETETLRETAERAGHAHYDGEILCPFFLEGGRYTLNDIHYVREGDHLVPAAQTEFAKDQSFGYTHSDLPGYVEEKTGGAVKREQVVCIPLEMLRAGDAEGVRRMLQPVTNFGKVAVNAAAYEDVAVFLTGYLRSIRLDGKQFLFRTAAAVPKLLGGIEDRPLLTRGEMRGNSMKGGLILAGSHVQKTTDQLRYLQESIPSLISLEFYVARLLEENGLEAEAQMISSQVNQLIDEGKTVLVFTSRKRLDLFGASQEEQLKASVRISNAVTSIVSRLTVQPAFIIAKGGITSSDVGVHALKVKRALVMGQIAPGIPVWQTDENSKFPFMPYVIFPGNVGSTETLGQIVKELL